MNYDGGRQVTAYVPATAPEAIVFADDGQLITSWGEALDAADLPPTMIIGAHRLEDETLRLHEYSPGRSTNAFAFDRKRFAAHEKFFVEDVRRWAATRLGAKLPAGRPNCGVRCLKQHRAVRQPGAELEVHQQLIGCDRGVARPCQCSDLLGEPLGWGNDGPRGG